MIKERVDCMETASPTDSPCGVVLEGNDGLSVTTSECSSQSNSRSKRCETPDGTPMPSTECSDFNSWMPIIDEEDRQARTLPNGRSFLDNNHQAQRGVCNQEYRKSAYQLQVRRWQDEETAYLRHEDWCEHRVILLMQEAFRCSTQNLKRAFSAGVMSPEVYHTRVTEIKNSLLYIKREYRRTLQRTRARKSDLSSIASKAVTCIASVFPWSCSGFVIGFEENVRFGQLLDKMGSGSRRGIPLAPPMPQQLIDAAVAPCCEADRMEGVVLSGLPPEHVDTPARLRDDFVPGSYRRPLATARVTLSPFPPRCQLFRRELSGDGPQLLSPVSAGTLAETVPSSIGALPSESFNRSFCAFSPHCLSPKSPAQVQVPPVSLAGPFRNDERRFLEKCQIVVRGMAFVSRSLASSIFISSRRATIAAATMQERLALTKDQAKPPALHPRPGSSVVKKRLSPPPSPSCKAGIAFPKVNPMNANNGFVGASTISTSPHVRQSKRRPSPSLARDSGSFQVSRSPGASGEPTPPSHPHAVAVSSEYTLVHPVQLPSYYPRRISRGCLCVDRTSGRSPLLSLPPVPFEEEKHVKELW
ncbi:hypothetical protein JKF63_03434 [Porcisia hertigi]|uniref:Ch28 protein n=1 Tax=Porcisia hertigi TaxID=2761500 RepID=A0A836I8D5_9TRYP|nr:hypothetical protein JKF63_03434 [Porcisia hertigi]